MVIQVSSITPPAPDIQPGDVLLYSGKGVFSWIIKAKTLSRISHAEILVENNVTWTSRDGKGSNFYPLTLTNLDTVMRPIVGCEGDLVKGIAWAKQYCGRPYDWKGLLAFSAFRWKPYTQERFFCSEAVVRFCTEAGCQIFNSAYRADDVFPGMLLTSPHLEIVWQADPEVA